MVKGADGPRDTLPGDTSILTPCPRHLLLEMRIMMKMVTYASFWTVPPVETKTMMSMITYASS